MNNIKERAAGNGCLRVLGVDPAAAGPTGYGIVESDGQCCRVLHYGALKSVSKQQRGWSGAALQGVHALIYELIEEFAPDAMAVESVFTALNMRTALRLAEVRGVVLLAAAQHGLEVHSYAPREVKASIAGHGHADKRQVQTMVRALLSMTVTPEPEDAADALVAAGIRGILNFAPVLLRIPPEVRLVSVDLTVQLEQLAFLVQTQTSCGIE